MSDSPAVVDIKERLQPGGIADEGGVRHQDRWSVVVEILARLERKPELRPNVFITGETGTGKEYLAKLVHALWLPESAPFVPVQCSAFPETLLEAEMFGHKKGAFTGAGEDRLGCIERAAGGTLFLDEISTAPPSIQIKLLRVLNDKVVCPLGGDPKPMDFNLISATNEEDLPGTIREDLYYRLRDVPIHLPPLRERPRDLLPALQHFLKEVGWKEEVGAGVADVLKTYSWPGNLRDLRSVAKQMVLMSNGEMDAALAERVLAPLRSADVSRRRKAILCEMREVDAAILNTEDKADVLMLLREQLEQLECLAPRSLWEIPPPYGEPIRDFKTEMQRRYASRLFQECAGNVKEMATRAGQTPKNIGRWIDQFGLGKDTPASVNAFDSAEATQFLKFVQGVFEQASPPPPDKVACTATGRFHHGVLRAVAQPDGLATVDHLPPVLASGDGQGYLRQVLKALRERFGSQ